MVISTDGRRLGVAKNGACFVSMSDDRRSNEFILDFARPHALADALDVPELCSVSDTRGQVLQLQVARGGLAGGDGAPEMTPIRLILGKPNHEPHGRPQQPTGPWELNIEAGRKLAAEIRQAVA